jgi:hypothetical protein
MGNCDQCEWKGGEKAMGSRRKKPMRRVAREERAYADESEDSEHVRDGSPRVRLNDGHARRLALRLSKR